MLDEKKGTCCHRCGHVHVKGTSCPTPFLKGERSCERRSLEEAIETDHYKERKAERGTILDIELPEAVYGDGNLKDIKSRLIPILQAKLDSRLSHVEKMDLGMSNNLNLGLVVFMPVIPKGDRLLPIKMICGDGGQGHYYLVIAANNALITMYPSSKKMADLEQDVKRHVKEERPQDLRPPKAEELSGYLFKMDIDGNEVKDVEKKPEVQRITKQSQPYEIKAAYKPKSTFTLKEPIMVKGKPVTTGTVVNAAVGGKRAGEPDGSGKVDWVEVDFGRGEKLVSGKLVPSYDMFKPVYTTSYRFKDEINEMSLQNPGAKELVSYLDKHPDVRQTLGFASTEGVVDYIEALNPREWYDFIKEVGQAKKELDETDQYCPSCLAEYLLEYKDKIEEAEYRGRKVQLGKPFYTPDGPKKRSVYVKNAKGNVVKVNFGDPNMKIKKSIPARRKSYRARHHCQSPGPRWKANYWSCRAW